MEIPLALGGRGPASPDFFRCSRAKLPPGAREINCCPPKTNEAVIQDFKFPVTRIRPPAHLANPEYLAKFNKALQLMKELPESDPRNFNQQAAVHCAYCVDSYPQEGVQPDQVFQVHYSWLFLPFHRWYLYFFERILGKLIDDPTFAIPFWNWDSPKGMQMPSFYTVDQKNSPFYDTYRNTDHLPPTLVDLNFCPDDPSETNRDTIIKNNLIVMHKQMVTGATTPELFLGHPYRAGDSADEKNIGEYSHHGAGSLENVPHNTVHDWCGDPSQPNGEDMGHFYSAGFDPIFYGHHANVDRLWTVWKTIPGRQDFEDDDWLNASFVFFDENCNPVRVYVKDCLDTRKLGYVYEDVPNEWLDAKPTPGKGAIAKTKAAEGVPFADDVFPAKLEKTVKAIAAIVPRPKKSRSKEEKEKEEEVLLIDGIEVEANVFVKFDVFINEEDEETSGPHKTEWAGSFVNLRHTQKMKTCLKLGISELLEDLGAEAEDDENVLVTLVPKAGAGHVSIGAVKIDYLSK